MPTRQRKDIPPEEPARLNVPRAEVQDKIRSQIEKGKQILSQQFNSAADVELLLANYGEWNDFNKELLGVLFSGKRILEDYGRHDMVAFSSGGGPGEQVRVYRQLVSRAIRELESLEQRLDLIPEIQPRQT